MTVVFVENHEIFKPMPAVINILQQSKTGLKAMEFNIKETELPLDRFTQFCTS